MVYQSAKAGRLAGDDMLRDSSSRWRERDDGCVSKSQSARQKFVSTGRNRRNRNVACKRAARERGRQDLITFCRAVRWKLVQLHDVDVVPCYHVNGRLNVRGRDKRVCGPAIYVCRDKFGVIDPAGEKAGRILSLDVVVVYKEPELSFKFEDILTIDTLVSLSARAANFYFYLFCDVGVDIAALGVSFVFRATDVIVNCRRNFLCLQNALPQDR